jgi:hypothetical protein
MVFMGVVVCFVVFLVGMSSGFVTDRATPRCGDAREQADHAVERHERGIGESPIGIAKPKAEVDQASVDQRPREGW